MPSFIIKLHDDKANKDYYLEWSTVVDAPVTWGMSLSEFKAYYKNKYGTDGMANFEQRISRVEEKGTSSYFDDNVDSIICHNRAGKNESLLPKNKLIDYYCVRRTEP